MFFTLWKEIFPINFTTRYISILYITPAIGYPPSETSAAHIACCEIELNDALPAEIAIQSFSPIICSSAYHEKTTFIVGGGGYEENDTEIAFSL